MKFTIYRKLMLGFGVIIAVVMLANAYMLLELGRISNGIKTAVSSNLRVIDQAKKLQVILDDETAHAQKFLISVDNTYFSMFSESTRRYRQLMRSLQDMELDETGQSLLKLVDILHESVLAGIYDEEAAEIPSHDKLPDYYDSMKRNLATLIEHNQSIMRNALAGFEASTRRSVKVALLVTICTLVSAIAISFWIARTITRPVRKLIERTGEIARGRFVPVSVGSNDEIALLADAVNEMSSKLKRMNELKAEMMQQISHELQNPLQVILSAHDFLRSEIFGKLNEKQLFYLDSIHKGVKRLSAFGHEYMEIAKMETEMIQYHLRPTELAAIVQPIVEEAKLIAAAKKISVDFHLQDSVPKAMVDPEKMDIVVRNLISNAVKYTPNGGKVSVGIAPSPGGAKVTITDNGIGIAPEELPKIFDKFYRVRSNGKIKASGKGVGLALVKALTEGQGGRVIAQSDVNVGSTFIVELQGASENYQNVHFLKPAAAKGQQHA